MILSIILGILITSFTTPSFAQFESGGVDKQGTWYVGEGLKQGDFFSYSMCHVDYKECTNFEMDFWIKGDKQVGSETKWLAEVVVYDGSKVIVGELELGKVAPEPTGGSPELGPYRGAFKSSIAWLSAFATSDASSGGKGPKAWSATSWGKIGNIGGEQVKPMAIEKISVTAGTFDTVVVGWKTGGKTSKIWVVDEFPFPVKAETFTHVSEGIPPAEYRFQLLEYRNVPKNPNEGKESTDKDLIDLGCQIQYDKVSLKKPTKNFDYQVHVFYGPENPIQGCPMEFQINFISKYDDTEFLNQVQFDLISVDENLKPLRSLANEDNKQFLYSPSGQTNVDMIVKEKPGIAHYAIWIYGLAPEWTLPETAPDYLILDIPISPPKNSTTPPPPSIPSWIKNNAGWWADGQIDDNSFVQGIQWLIQQGIMKITS